MDKKTKKKIKNGFRVPTLLWCMLVGALMLFGISFAWFTMVEREADSKTAAVMRPYHLTLLNPSESDVLQLSIGSLMPDRTKQILFCVSNKYNQENDAINMGGDDFDYFMELIHTDNLALNYKLYVLESVPEEEVTNETLVAEDVVNKGEDSITYRTYWRKGLLLPGEDVSTQRHIELGLSGEEWNRGTYISYTEDGESNKLHLSSDTVDGYDSQYFLLEIDWQEDAAGNFEKYDKETDMMYMVVKALQPEPEKIETLD